MGQLAGEPFWEFIERASNMAAPLALFYIRRPTSFFEWFTAGPYVWPRRGG